MHPIFIVTNNRIRDRAVKEGYKRIRTSYYRLMDGYVQSFKLYTYHLSYSIRFYQEPLCVGLDSRYEGSDAHIFWHQNGPFSTLNVHLPDEVVEKNEFLHKKNPFDITLTRGNYVYEASEMLVRTLDEYVLPWFDKSDTIERAYEACLEIEPNYHPKKRFAWMLQMKRYKEAAVYLEQDIESLKMYNIAMQYPENDEYICKRESFREALLREDMEIINSYVREMEEETLKGLRFQREYKRRQKDMMNK